MKKLKIDSKIRFCRISKNRVRKKEIRVLIKSGKIQKFPQEIGDNIAISAPRVLSIDHNFDETIDFFEKIKKLAAAMAFNARLRRHRAKFQITLTDVEHISTRSAVILAAEIDRLRRLTGIRLVYSGTSRHAEDTTAILADLGVLDLLTSNHETKSIEERTSGKTLVPLSSGRRVDSFESEKFDESLREVFASYHNLPALYEGRGEALLNVIHHAYPSKTRLRYPCPGHRWWATACADFINEEIRIFVYDQGVGVPATLPYSDQWERVVSLVTALPQGQVHNDAMLVKAAMEYARSSRRQSGRGKGFRDIMAAVDGCDAGRLRIASGKAEVTYCAKGVIETRAFNRHVGGTLIEWTLPTGVFG